MKFLKHLLTLFAVYTLVAVLAGCSKDDNDIVTPVEPGNPSGSGVTLTQFDVILGDQTTSGTVSNRASTESNMGGFNKPKTAFVAGDYFTFNYVNALQTSQKAYAYTSDGKTWTIHETEDANSPVKTIQLNSKSPTLSATFLSKNEANEEADKDGIVTQSGTGDRMLVGCYDALRATATVTTNSNKAIAKIPFQHVNHLLSFYVKGTINERAIDHLELSVSYTNAAGAQQNAVLLTSSRASYADTEGTTHTVIQAIVPRGGVVKDIKAIRNDNSEITTTNAEDIDCPGGKSHLVTLNVNDGTMSLQVGSLTDSWAFSGEMNPDGSPVGNVFIGTADEMRQFSLAVNTNPIRPGARIKNVLAYTANVVLTANIDLSHFDWSPIGGVSYDDEEGIPQTTYFAGTFNGNGFKISGMRVTTLSASGNNLVSHAGFFGNVQSPVEGYTILTNIQLVNVNIQLNDPISTAVAGALVGSAYVLSDKNPIIISQCSAQGTITVDNNGGDIFAGGLVGEVINTHITGSTTNVSVTANASSDAYTGGIVGQTINSRIASSYAQNGVVGHSSNASVHSGGITGSLRSGNFLSFIIACSSDGNVAANGSETYAGGIVGYCDGKITGCYAKGNVTSTSGNAKTGAIVGDGVSGIALCYGVGAVGAGTSNATAIPYNKVYNSNPLPGDILSIVSGKAWKEFHGTEKAEVVIGGILTTIPINTGGKMTLEVKPRLWVLYNSDVWTTSSPASSTFPLPATNYKGE